MVSPRGKLGYSLTFDSNVRLTLLYHTQSRGKEDTTTVVPGRLSTPRWKGSWTHVTLICFVDGRFFLIDQSLRVLFNLEFKLVKFFNSSSVLENPLECIMDFYRSYVNI